MCQSYILIHNVVFSEYLRQCNFVVCASCVIQEMSYTRGVLPPCLNQSNSALNSFDFLDQTFLCPGCSTVQGTYVKNWISWCPSSIFHLFLFMSLLLPHPTQTNLYLQQFVFSRHCPNTAVMSPLTSFFQRWQPQLYQSFLA